MHRCTFHVPFLFREKRIEGRVRGTLLLPFGHKLCSLKENYDGQSPCLTFACCELVGKLRVRKTALEAKAVSQAVEYCSSVNCYPVSRATLLWKRGFESTVVLKEEKEASTFVVAEFKRVCHWIASLQLFSCTQGHTQSYPV